MTTYKAFLQVLRKHIWTILLYTVILIVCVIGNSQNHKSMSDFTATKPSITIYDDDNSALSKKLKDYLSDRADIVELETEEELNDALYYDGVDYAIYIDEGFGNQIANGEKPEISVKSVSNYGAYLAETILARFIKIAEAHAPATEIQIVESLDEILTHETNVEITSRLDTSALANAKNYYNFMNYAILAGLVFAIAYSTAAFRRRIIRKRLAISATDHKTINRQLIACNLLVAAVLLISYIILGVLMVGDIMLSTNGLLFMANSAVLSIFAVSFAFLLTNLFKTNDSILAVVNVFSLGSCFLCGVFIPYDWMPKIVQDIGRILPSSYYIENNQLISELATINFETIKPLLLNAAIIIGATILMIIINNLVTRKQQKD